LYICDHAWDNPAYVANTLTRQIEWKGHKCVYWWKGFFA